MMKFDYKAFGTLEHCVWLNALLQSLWPQLGHCIQSVLQEEVQPLYVCVCVTVCVVYVLEFIPHRHDCAQQAGAPESSKVV